MAHSLHTRRLPLNWFELAMIAVWLVSSGLMLLVGRSDERTRAATVEQLQAVIRQFHTEPDQQRLMPEFTRLSAALSAWRPSPWRRRFLALVILGAAAFSVSRVRGFRSARREEKRMETGLCRQCGYDLRGSPDRCPECGTAVPSPLAMKDEGRNAV